MPMKPRTPRPVAVPNPAEELLSQGALCQEDCAVFMGLSVREVSELTASGRLPFFWHGRRKLVPKLAAVRLLAGEFLAQGGGLPGVTE